MNSTSILASAPDGEGYVNLIKVGVVLVGLLLWGITAQWIDRDTDKVKTQREKWNMIVLSGGLVSYFWLLVPPWSDGLFMVGLLGWLAIAGGPMLGYVLHRNGRVIPANRILTPKHFKQLLGLDKSGKKGVSTKGLRVQLEDHDGKFVEPPDEPGGLVAYDLVQDFLYDLLWRRATDVDLVITKDRYRLIYKIDGVATEKPDGVPLEDGERIIQFMKKIAGLNVEEIRRPQSGSIEVSLLNQEGPVGKTEVSTSGSTAGERLRLHIQAEAKLLRLQDLGITKQRVERVKKFLSNKNGIVLFSSPPENGLTTTQYAILRSHDAYINNIHALERKSLMDIDNITQQIYDGPNKDVDYARTLQMVLRREPDIVMVSDCDDRETARIAIRSAADNRKIYLGMHANDSFDALGKFLTWVGNNALSAKGLLGVVNQRLVRVLCEECREAFKPDPDTLKKLNLPADKIEHFYRPPTQAPVTKRGKEVICLGCQNTGYKGRVGVFEVLVIDTVISKLIADGAPINRIKAQCRKNKMYYLQEEGLLKVMDGTTSMNEVLRCLKTNDK